MVLGMGYDEGHLSVSAQQEAQHRDPSVLKLRAELQVLPEAATVR